jgi:hypothetical protein
LRNSVRCYTVYWATGHAGFTDSESSIGLWIIGSTTYGFGLMSVSESKGIEYLLGPSSFTGVAIEIIDTDRLKVSVPGSVVGNIPIYFAKLSMFEHH